MVPYSQPHGKVFQGFRKAEDPKINLFHGLILFSRELTSLLHNSTEILPKIIETKKMTTL